MKKLIGFALLACSAFALVSIQAPDAEAQYVPMTRQCCDAGGNVRCILINWTPIGNPCYCYGQGSGFAC